LSATEWTAYAIDGSEQQDCDVIVRVRSSSAPAQAELSIGEKTLKVNVTDNSWKDIKVGVVQFNRGANRLKWEVKQGTADLDWIDVGESGKSRQSAAPNRSPASEISSSD
jgi:hypothetical protein